MRKTLSLILTFILIASMFAGCAQPTTPEPPASEQTQDSAEPAVVAAPETDSTTELVTLSFWNGFTGPDGEILKQIVDRFNADNAGKIEVKMDVMGWDVLAQKLPPAIATKTAPGLALLIGDTIPQYLQNNALKPLDDFWAATGLKESDYVDSVLGAGKYNGQYFALPMQFNLIYLYWNKALFKQAGLDPETPPATLEELGQFAEKLTDVQNSQYGLGLPVKGAPQYWTSFFWNNGGELFDLENKTALIDSLENLQTLTWMQDLVVNKQVSPAGATGADIDNLMMSGKLGMLITGPWLVNGLKSNNIDFGMAAIPAGSARQQIISGEIGFVVPSSATEAEQMAAYEFIKYWMSDAVSKEWSLKNGFPAWKNSLLTDADITADPVQKAIAPLNSLGRAYNPTAYGAISAIDNDAIWPMIESVFIGGVSPADALKTANDLINSIFAAN